MGLLCLYWMLFLCYYNLVCIIFLPEKSHVISSFSLNSRCDYHHFFYPDDRGVYKFRRATSQFIDVSFSRMWQEETWSCYDHYLSKIQELWHTHPLPLSTQLSRDGGCYCLNNDCCEHNHLLCQPSQLNGEKLFPTLWRKDWVMIGSRGREFPFLGSRLGKWERLRNDKDNDQERKARERRRVEGREGSQE